MISQGIAGGTQPNTIPSKKNSTHATFQVDGKEKEGTAKIAHTIRNKQLGITNIELTIDPQINIMN
jgi:hypothetical protein